MVSALFVSGDGHEFMRGRLPHKPVNCSGHHRVRPGRVSAFPAAWGRQAIVQGGVSATCLHGLGPIYCAKFDSLLSP